MFKHSITLHSPMSWAHINMLGEYDFSDEKLKILWESCSKITLVKCHHIRE